MQYLRILSAPLVALALGCAGPGASPAASDEASKGDLYAMGVVVGKGFTRLALSEDEAEEMARGFRHGIGGDPAVEDPSPEALLRAQVFTEQRLREQSELEQASAAAFLEAAAREEGAVQTESGLVLRILEPGSGDPPDTMQFVRLHFHGTLRDGTVFLSTRGAEPRQYRLGTAIRCWQEALARVGPGAVLEVVCPPELGFGVAGMPPKVPGGAALSFELELLDVSDEP